MVVTGTASPGLLPAAHYLCQSLWQGGRAVLDRHVASGPCFGHLYSSLPV